MACSLKTEARNQIPILEANPTLSTDLVEEVFGSRGESSVGFRSPLIIAYYVNATHLTYPSPCATVESLTEE